MHVRSTAYHTRRARATLFLAAMVALAGCTSARGASGGMFAAGPTITLRALRPFFVPGETITWSVSLAGVEGGRARLAVGKAGDVGGRRVVMLRAEAESAGLLALVRKARDAVSSWVDVDSGIPTRTESETYGLERDVKVAAARTADKPMCEFHIWNRQPDASGASPEGQTRLMKLPMIETHDPLSAVLAIRAWDAPRGGRAVMYSLGGVRVWRTELAVEKREEIKGPLGRRNTVRITGVARRLKASLEEDTSRPARTFTVWVTDDDQRIPLQITAHTEYGDVVAKATSYEVTEQP